MSQLAMFCTCDIGPLDKRNVAAHSCVLTLVPFAEGRVVDSEGRLLEQGKEGNV